MLKAQIHRKLPSEIWENNEDLLTSAVFGTLANLPDAIIAEVFGSATPLDPGPGLTIEPPLAWEFWPWWDKPGNARDGCEPDVVIQARDALVVVEAKLWSAFGTEPGKRDQLDREWRHGVREAQARGLGDVWLVAVTAHLSVPRDEIVAQLAGLNCDLSHVFWLSWTSIARALNGARVDPRFADARGWLTDVVQIVASVGLAPFQGYADLAARSLVLFQPGARPQVVVEKRMYAAGVGFADVFIKADAIPFELLMWTKEQW